MSIERDLTSSFKSITNFRWVCLFCCRKPHENFVNSPKLTKNTNNFIFTMLKVWLVCHLIRNSERFSLFNARVYTWRVLNMHCCWHLWKKNSFWSAPNQLTLSICVRDESNTYVKKYCTSHITSFPDFKNNSLSFGRDIMFIVGIMIEERRIFKCVKIALFQSRSAVRTKSYHLLAESSIINSQKIDVHYDKRDNPDRIMKKPYKSWPIIMLSTSWMLDSFFHTLYTCQCA